MEDVKINELPTISIVTVVYNCVKTIERTILSVINQPYPKKEYIIIDGGSNDGTVEIIKKYEGDLSWWISEPDKGIYDAMNRGIEKANGELIGTINADDWYEENILGKIAEYYRAGSDHIIYGLLRIFQNNELYSIRGNTIRTLNEETIMHPTCFIPRSVYKTFGNYNCDYASAADYELFLRYVNNGVKFKFIEEIIANFQRGGISSNQKSEKEKYRIQAKYNLISFPEYFFRMLQLHAARIIRRFN